MARTLLQKAASEPRKAAAQQDENHEIEVVDVSRLGDGQVLEKVGSVSHARGEVSTKSGEEDEATSPHPLAWSLAGVQELRESLKPVTSQKGLRGIIPSTFAAEGVHRDECLIEVQEQRTRVRSGVTSRAAASATAAELGCGTGELKFAPPRTTKNREEQGPSVDALLSCRINMEASLEDEFTICHSKTQPSQEFSRETNRSAVAPRLNKEQPLQTLKFAHRCLSELTTKPRASLPSSPAHSSSVRPRSSSQPPVARLHTNSRQNSERFTKHVHHESTQRIQQEVSQLTHLLNDMEDMENIHCGMHVEQLLDFYHRTSRLEGLGSRHTPCSEESSSSCPAGENPSYHPEIPGDEAGLIPDLVHARVQEEAHQVDPSHLQQVRKSDLDSPTAPHERELDLNPLGEDLMLGPTLRKAQKLITKAVATQQADLFDAWAQDQGGKVDVTPIPTVDTGLGEPETEPEAKRSLDE
ncbi:hypothetical protein SELMODRAFT_430517 [Selaginella moellendorffii]|uniref:Uncharacterized protein n=1 Tax=Selaginella moellendorffii TaxID=88036 RepID=D8T9N2_SELML|nr:hypothetical protein SELMODRAFT_430517 [Selaginella moellendorffii]